MTKWAAPGAKVVITVRASGAVVKTVTGRPGALTPQIDVYINGVPAYSATGYLSSYEYRPLSKAAQQSIHPNADNQIAVHCHQTEGGQYIDVGISERIPSQR